MTLQVFQAEDFVTTQWSGGETIQLLIWPEDGSLADRDFAYRISSAKVETSPSVFSDFSGFDRWISVLEGRMVLTHPGQDPIDLAPFECYHFDGGIETKSQGLCRDFNLIYRAGAYQADLLSFSELKSTTLSMGESDHYFIYLYQGRLDISGFDKKLTLEAGQGLWARGLEGHLDFEGFESSQGFVCHLKEK